MNSSLARPILGLWLLVAGMSPAAAQKFEIQYFYDRAKSSFVICDMQFASVNRGVAVGVIRTGKRDRVVDVPELRAAYGRFVAEERAGRGDAA